MVRPELRRQRLPEQRPEWRSRRRRRRTPGEVGKALRRRLARRSAFGRRLPGLSPAARRTERKAPLASPQHRSAAHQRAAPKLQHLDASRDSLATGTFAGVKRTPVFLCNLGFSDCDTPRALPRPAAIRSRRTHARCGISIRAGRRHGADSRGDDDRAGRPGRTRRAPARRAHRRRVALESRRSFARGRARPRPAHAANRRQSWRRSRRSDPKHFRRRSSAANTCSIVLVERIYALATFSHWRHTMPEPARSLRYGGRAAVLRNARRTCGASCALVSSGGMVAAASRAAGRRRCRGGSATSAARSISATNECDVFCTSRMKRPGLPHHLRQAVRTEQQQRQDRNDQNVGNREHAPVSFPRAAAVWPAWQGSPAGPCKLRSPSVKIIYTRGNRTETLASLATLRKILNRFVAHRVFYEVSSRSKRGHEFFSTKNVFVVGAIEVTNFEHLKISDLRRPHPSALDRDSQSADDAHLRRDARPRVCGIVPERERAASRRAATSATKVKTKTGSTRVPRSRRSRCRSSSSISRKSPRPTPA